MNRLSPGFSTKSTANVADTINSECPSSVGRSDASPDELKRYIAFLPKDHTLAYTRTLRKAPTRLGLSMIQPVSSITSRCKAGIGCSRDQCPSGKLKLRFWVILMRQQQVFTYRQKRIHPRSALIEISFFTLSPKRRIILIFLCWLACPVVQDRVWHKS